jgi:predicted AlkP superfamily pyrophosphatase or phosphodiesterase
VAERRNWLPKKTTVLLFLSFILSLWFFPARSRPAVAGFPRRPKLVLILVIDQFRYDYLERFRPQFVERGFKLLLNGGANFVDCRYDYATIVTGPGHATLFTGTYPNIHGIISNQWYDRHLRRPVYCVEDANTKLVTGSSGPSPAPGFSPARLVGSTIGDELRAATDFRSKVISISIKDRAAILMGGHSPNATYWFDPTVGGFVTSTYYLPALPAWVDQFNQQSPTKRYCGLEWKALSETPGAGGTVLSEFKPEPNESCPDANFLAWLDETPFMNELELAFVRAAIRNEHLGQGPDTDLLAVSLSVNDSVGHAFGPYSPQVADCTLRTDRALAGLFDDLDKTIGLSNVWIALSADHGVAPNPVFIHGHNLGLGNAPAGVIRGSVEQAMVETLGQENWIEGGDGFGFYFDQSALRTHRIQPSRAEAIAAEAAVSTPGVIAAFTRTQFMTGTLPNSPLARKAANSYYPQRSPDVFIVMAPYAVPTTGQEQTSHGSPWSYDAQVPMVLMGREFKPGNYATPCQPTDLAATLAAVLGLTQPSGTEGHPLVPALQNPLDKK